MAKLKLTPEQDVIFQQALSDAFKAGSEESTFLFNGMPELIQGQEKRLKKITKEYCEKQ
jgi:hypothetical protein